jgi:hypothetical protein
MTINSIIEQFFEDARAAGLSLDKQNAMAAEVIRRLRPEWSGSQIADSINRVIARPPRILRRGTYGRDHHPGS